VASDISRSLVVLSGIGPRWRRSEQESSSRANGRTRLRHRSGKLALSCVTDRCEPRRREVFSRALVGDTGTDGPTPRVTTSGSKRRPNSRAASATSAQPPSIISPCPRPGVYRGRGGPVGTTETARDAPRRDALSSYNRGVKSVSVPQRSDRQTGRRQDRPPSQPRHSRSRRRGPWRKRIGHRFMASRHGLRAVAIALWGCTECVARKPSPLCTALPMAGHGCDVGSFHARKGEFHRPCRTLERGSPQGGDLRLACVRDRGVCDRRLGGHGDPEGRRRRERPVAAGGPAGH